MHPISPPFPPIKYKPGAESGSSVTFSLGDAQPNPLPCPSVSGTTSLNPEGSPTAGRDPTSVRRLSSEGCDLRRPINTAKAEAAWVMVPMGSSSRYVKSAGTPLAPPTHTSPRGQVPHTPTSQEHSSSLPSGKTPKPTSLLLFWDGMYPIPLSKLVAGTGTCPSLYNQANAPKERGAQSCPRTVGELQGITPGPVAVTALQQGDFGLYISPVEGGQQETGQPISPVLSSKARTEGWGPQPAALDEEPGIPACSSVTLTPSCPGVCTAMAA